MAFDASAIRKKLAELSGKNNQKNLMWRPEEGKNYSVRIIALPGAVDGSPFRELYFYYGIGNNPGILTLKQFGKPDPVQELITQLRASGQQSGYELAKKLYPKMRAYAAVIVRGQEDEGVKLWAFGKTVYQSLLGYLVDPDYGDITDIKDGFDIRVTVEKAQGKQYADTTVTARRQPSKLSDDPSKVKQWLENLPNLDELYTPKSYDELLKILNDWMATTNGSDASTEEAPRGNPDKATSVRSRSSDDDDDEENDYEKPRESKAALRKLNDVFDELNAV